MSREESKMMQGVAILIMIFFHLFNSGAATDFRGTIVGQLAMVNNPVPFYVFLSGYGLYRVHEKGVDSNKFYRYIRLYVHYWVITTVFITFSQLTQMRNYDLSLPHIALNFTGWKTDYYESAWFVLPYVLLSLSSPFIFKKIDRYGSIVMLAISYVTYLIASYMNRYDVFSLNFFQVFYIQFSFVLGAVFARHSIIQHFRTAIGNTPPKYYTSYCFFLLLSDFSSRLELLHLFTQLLL